MSLGIPLLAEARGNSSANNVESILDMGLSFVFVAVSGPKRLGCMSCSGLNHEYWLLFAFGGWFFSGFGSMIA